MERVASEFMVELRNLYGVVSMELVIDEFLPRPILFYFYFRLKLSLFLSSLLNAEEVTVSLTRISLSCFVLAKSIDWATLLTFSLAKSID